MAQHWSQEFIEAICDEDIKTLVVTSLQHSYLMYEGNLHITAHFNSSSPSILGHRYCFRWKVVSAVQLLVEMRHNCVVSGQDGVWLNKLAPEPAITMKLVNINNNKKGNPVNRSSSCWPTKTQKKEGGWYDSAAQDSQTEYMTQELRCHSDRLLPVDPPSPSACLSAEKIHPGKNPMKLPSLQSPQRVLKPVWSKCT